MIGRGLPHAGLGLLLSVLGACAEPVNDVSVVEAAGAGGGGGVISGSCQAPTCGACTTCKDMCLCLGSSLAQCQSICATGSGGKAGAGGSGGSGATGGYGATGGSGATGGYAGGGGYAGSGGSTCAVKLGDPTCDACLASQCCTEAEACAYDQSCGDLMTCLAQAPACQSAYSLSELMTCADTACPAYAAGKTSFSGYVSCLSTRCATECGM